MAADGPSGRAASLTGALTIGPWAVADGPSGRGPPLTGALSVGPETGAALP
ncbi:hypothetical protein ACWEOZ_06225 [Actinoplanes sp. NPDC004185]